MASTTSPDLPTGPFEFGMPILVLQLASPSTSQLTQRSTQLPRLTGNAMYLGLMTTLPMCAMHCHMFPPNPLVVQCVLISVQSPTRKVGSGTQRGAFYTGYNQTALQTCLCLFDCQSPGHPFIDPFVLILTTLLLEPLGPKFSKEHLI